MNDRSDHPGGAFADGLTLIRFLLTPLVMFIIIKGWPANDAAVLASVLFTIAALTDIFDDLTGGAETAPARKLGWFDDIADMVLMAGTLAAMVWVVHKSGQLAWPFAVPAGIIIIREILIGLFKGPSMIKNGWPETHLGNLRTFLTMLAVCLLVASPWLTTWIDSMRADDSNIVNIYDSNSPMVWMVGQGLLWIAALLSLYTGIQLLSGKTRPSNDA